MNVYIALAIVLSATIILLAFMATTLKLDFDWIKGKKLPKIQINFKKDPSLFKFLRKTSDEEGHVDVVLEEKKDLPFGNKGEESDESREEENDSDIDFGYKTLAYFGKAYIKYGEQAESIAKLDLLIQATRNDVDKFYYFNADSGSKIRLINGFKNINKKFVKMRDVDTWDGTVADGVFSELNRVSMNIPCLRKGEELKLSFELKVKIHYHELVGKTRLVSHDFHFRMPTLTEGVNLQFHIPHGEKSDFVKFNLISHLNDKKRILKKFKNVETDIYSIDKEYGGGWVRKDQIYNSVYWNIPSPLKAGEMCKLEWFTRKKGAK